MTKNKIDTTITLNEWAGLNNIPEMLLSGLKAELKHTDKNKPYKEGELDKAYSKFLNKPIFVKQK